jgi:hypothetical protein
MVGVRVSATTERTRKVERAIEHLRKGLATGHADEYTKAQGIARALAAEARLSAEERARRERKRQAARTRAALAGPAAAYARSKKRKAA